MKRFLMLALLVVCGCTYETYEIVPEEEGEMNRSELGWSVSGKITAGTNQSKSTQVEFPEPGNYTVELSISGQQEGLGANEFVAAKALIEWSVKGNTARRVVSVANGMAVTGAAEAVKVQIQDESQLSGSTGLPYNVAANIVKGVRGSHKLPPYYERGEVTTIAAAASQVFALSSFAAEGIVSVMMMVGDETGDDWGTDLIVRHRSTVAFLKSYCVIPGVYEYVPLSPGTTHIVVFNNSALELVVKPIFGIDG